MKIPVFLPVTREFGFRDEFAQDCLLQRRVGCEPGTVCMLTRTKTTLDRPRSRLGSQAAVAVIGCAQPVYPQLRKNRHRAQGVSKVP